MRQIKTRVKPILPDQATRPSRGWGKTPYSQVELSRCLIDYHNVAEQEADIDQVHDIVHEHAGKTSWGERVALTTALFAVFAAVSSLLSTHESDKAILYRVESSDQWSYYQAKGIKGIVTQSAEGKERYLQE